MPLAAASEESGEPGASKADGLTLSIGNYGLPAHRVEEAVRLIAGAGFDGIELALMADRDSAPERLDAARRRGLRRLLEDSRLRLTSLMEDLPPTSDDARRQAALDRLTRAAELGRDLSPERPPLVQTVLGGGVWEEKKELLLERLEDWSRLAQAEQMVIAIKPHRSGAMSTPGQAAWLLGQLGKPSWLGMVFDYSHYAFRDLPLEETIVAAAPYTVHLAVKDAVERDGSVVFDLPGAAGTIDYTALLAGFYRQGYRGDVCCEVSSQVFRREDYDAIAATQACYRALASAFERAGVARISR